MKIEGDSKVSEEVMKDGTLAKVEKGIIGAKYLEVLKSVCFLENAVFVVQVPVSEYN